MRLIDLSTYLTISHSVDQDNKYRYRWIYWAPGISSFIQGYQKYHNLEVTGRYLRDISVQNSAVIFVIHVFVFQ